MWWRNYSQSRFLKVKIELISEPVVYSFIQFVFIGYQIEDRRSILKVIAEYLLLSHLKLFQKTKRGFELVVPA